MTRIIALVGEAGTGKDTLLHEAVKQYPDRLNEIVSCTTRPPREGEVDGKNYYFMGVMEFDKKVDSQDMLESTMFNGWFYGTSKASLSADKVNIGVFNPCGIYNLAKKKDIELIIFRVNCSSKERLLRQLNREKDPDVDEIVRRYGTDKNDFAIFDAWDHPVINLNNNSQEDIARNIATIGRYTATIGQFC